MPSPYLYPGMEDRCEILALVNQYAGFDIKKRTNKRTYVDFRIMTTRILLDNNDMWEKPRTLEDIGDILGVERSKHCSVIHYRKEFAKLYGNDAKFTEEYIKLKEYVDSNMRGSADY